MGETLPHNRQFDSYFSGRRLGVLDIETTGLNRTRDCFILGGLLDVTEGTFHQIFAQNTGEEAEALEAFFRLMEPLDAVITYNGRQFDMPFLQERGRRAGLGTGPAPYDLDLYQVVRRHSPLKRLLPNLKQTTVENYLGLWMSRTDEITGAESVDLYRQYVQSKDPLLEEKILLHNSDDVCQLTRLLKVLDKCDFHQAMYSLGFPAGPAGMGLVVREITCGREKLIISGDQGEEAFQFRCYELDGYPVDIAFEKDSRTFVIRLPVIDTRGVWAVDLRAAGLEEAPFENYPESGSGFLVIGENRTLRSRACNHLVRAYVDRIAPLLVRE